MDVCKCVVPVWQGGTLNIHRATGPLKRLVEKEERWEALDYPLKFGVEMSQIVLSPVWCPKAIAKDKHNLVALHFKYDFWHRTATAGSDVVQSGRPIFDDFFQHLWPYIGNNTANVVFQMVKRLWLIRIDQ
ncbi:adhesion G protein-coupled receptor B2 [Trichonephila clavipes]|nr:adhesion G protein-coupled receptor B2 [Trichonephila clavipes]